MERGPIFVAGLERSGTSLLFALLASHPNVAMTRRTNLWRHFYEQFGDLGESGNLDRCLATMTRYKRLRVLDPDFARLRRDFITGGARTYARLFALLEEQHAARLGRPRWGDKSLHTEQWTEPIFAGYPGARILHMIRDPRDRYASSRTRWALRRGGIGGGVAEWRASARLAIEHERRFPDRYRAVRYEDLASAPEATVRRLCDFVDEPYAPEMLAMGGAPRLLEQGSNSSYGSRPPGIIAPDSIGRFRDVLSAYEIRFAGRAAAEEMDRFGYPDEPVRFGPLARTRYSVATVPFETARAVAWRTVEGRRDRAGRPVPDYRMLDEVATP
jgi:hypothetical protein